MGADRVSFRTVQIHTDEVEAKLDELDEQRWDMLFAKSPDVLRRLAAQAEREDRDGLCEELEGGGVMDRPIKNCYWVLRGKLLAGEYPRTKEELSSEQKLAALSKAGVNVFVDLTEAGELAPYADSLPNATHYRFPIRDVSVPSSVELTTEVLNTIDDHIERGDLVYVHCWGGVGRTGVIVGCWLARRCGSGELALRRLAELWCACPKSTFRPWTPETPEQTEYVRKWLSGQ